MGTEDLFASAAEARLRQAGWLCLPVGDVAYWRAPGSPTTYSRDEAIALLDARERGERSGANGHD